MLKLNIVRYWKDEEYRLSLADSERQAVPDSPAGAIEVSDFELDSAVGASTEHLLTIGCCSGLTTDPGFCSFGCPSVQCSSRVCPTILAPC